MSHFRIDERDVFFILKNQLDYGRLCRLPRYRELSEKSLDLLVAEGLRFARGILDPINEVGDRIGARFQDGGVLSPPGFVDAFRRCGELGFVAVSRDTALGGQGFPHMMRIVVNDFMYGACQAFNMAPSLTHGAAHLIEAFGSSDLKSRFVPPMYAGRWAGTMCLTEPGAGSDLGALTTSAFADGQGYKIRGEKIFISWGDHDLTENIVHLVLARIDGAPGGSRGLSLFVVPKIRVEADGSLGEPNDVVCARIEEKLGLHGSPTAALRFGGRDGCLGYLVGQRDLGLSHMFQMMNQARINTAVSAMALASTAFRNALEYARGRVQGRDIRDPAEPPVPILHHPDVRRMLLWMKAATDGMRSLIYACALWQDLSLEQESDRDHYRDLVDFMTPVVKAYCSETGFRVCETAIQCMGGHGYCRDYPLEQYLRDAKIMSLYEGTSGIQALDLMGRKMRLRGGACLAALRREMGGFFEAHRADPLFGDRVRALEDTASMLWELAAVFDRRRDEDPRRWAAHTFPALMAFGETVICWRLLDMARIAADLGQEARGYYAGKVHQAAHFLDTTLPHTRATIQTCLEGGSAAVDIADRSF